MHHGEISSVPSLITGTRIGGKRLCGLLAAGRSRSN